MLRFEQEARQSWARIRSNPEHLPNLVILPTQLTPTNQKKWFDSLVVKQGATLVEAATEYYSHKRKYEPAAEAYLLYNGGSVFDIVAK